MIDAVFLGTIGVWTTNILYFICLIPQVRTNIQMRSAKGLSKTMVYLYFTAYLFKTVYAYLLNLPLAYRVVVPATLVMITTLVAQLFVYEEDPREAKRLFLKYATTVLLAGMVWWFKMEIALSFFGNGYLLNSGNFAGWVYVIAISTYQLPQIYKIWQEQSTQGFNFMFVTLHEIGAAIEISSYFLLGLPLQTLLNGLRGVITYGVYLYLFLRYSK